LVAFVYVFELCELSEIVFWSGFGPVWSLRDECVTALPVKARDVSAM